MNIKSIVLLLALAGFTSSAFASNFIDKVTSKSKLAHSSIVKTHKTAKTGDPAYTDFSGTWIMNCDGVPPFTTVIENDVYHISIDGEEFYIGPGLIGNSRSNENYIDVENKSLEWNANGSELVLKDILISKTHRDNSSLETYMDLTTLKMNKGQIIVESKFMMLEDLSGSDPETMRCVLTKKQ